MSETTPLLFSKQGKGRIAVGLSWDPREDKVKLVNQILRKDSQHDMDLSCFLFDAGGDFLDFVGAEAQDSMDQSGRIYHSGDDMTGEGGGDDETISAELAELPEDVHALVFLAEIKSRHVFGDIEAPSARLYDALSREILLELPLAADPGDSNKIACVLWTIARDDASPTGWSLRVHNACPDLTDVTEWGDFLARYLA